MRDVVIWLIFLISPGSCDERTVRPQGGGDSKGETSRVVERQVNPLHGSVPRCPTGATALCESSWSFVNRMDYNPYSGKRDKEIFLLSLPTDGFIWVGWRSSLPRTKAGAVELKMEVFSLSADYVTITNPGSFSSCATRLWVKLIHLNSYTLFIINTSCIYG